MRGGSYDMLGNVSEWVYDCGGTVPTPAPEDGSAWVWEACESRVRRGGLWDASLPEAGQDALRALVEPGRQAADTGFRVAFDGTNANGNAAIERD